MTTDRPDISDFAKLWPLDPDAIYLNHGSFGACPRFILEKQSEYRRMLESHPVRFLIRELEERFDQSRRKVAAFVNASPEDIVFVLNATAAVNTVFRSLTFHPGDEILLTNHSYGACKRIVEFICERSGARLVEAVYDFPITSAEVILRAVLSKVTSRTRIALIDHITSATGIIQPVEKIVKELDILGIDTMIDGAHAIGSIPLDLENTGAAYYTANCHKWLCSPKSTALLHVRSDKQKGIIPLIISHAGHRAEPFAERFYWPGTADPTPALCVGDAIDYMATLVQGQWPEIMERNHQMCIRGRDVICNALKIEPPCPDNMVASMATLPLPNPSEISIPDYKGIEMLQDFFFRKYNLEVPVLFWDTPPRRFTRISAQLYNAPWQYSFYAEKLAEALKIDVRN